MSDLMTRKRRDRIADAVRGAGLQLRAHPPASTWGYTARADGRGVLGSYTLRRDNREALVRPLFGESFTVEADPGEGWPERLGEAIAEALNG